MNKRTFVVGILTLVVCAATLYFHGVVGTDIIFPHLYYLPIILAAIWWERRSWFLTVSLGLFLLGSHVISGIEAPITSCLARAASFLLVGGVAAELARAGRLAGEALQASYRHQAAILGSMLDVVVVANPDGAIRTVNRAALELLGYAEEELIGQSVGAIFEEEEEEEEEEFFRGRGLAQLVREGAARDVEMTLLTKSGERIPVVFNGSVIQEEDGRLAAVVGVARDVRERKRAEEALASSNVKLAAANKELEAFAYSISHDLRAPLRHTDRFAQLLLQREAARLEPTSARYLQNIVQSAGKMGRLIDDLLALSRTSQTEMKLRRVAPNEIVEQVRQELEPASEGRRITWEIAPLPAVQADPGLLRIVWTNLLSNAVKYTAPRPQAHIEIGAAPPDGEGQVTFFVRDDGVGFDPQYAHKLFGVFQRLHRDEEFEGSGIGLATVRRIIHRHGGRVWAEGEVDRGATFYFTLRS